MVATFAAILTAFLLGSLIYHSGRTTSRAHPLWSPTLHATVVSLVAYLLLGNFHWPILLCLFLTQAGLHAIGLHRPSASLAPWLALHFVNLGLLLALAYCFPAAALDGWWATAMTPEHSRWYFVALTFSSGLMLCIPAGGELIARITRRFAAEIRDTDIAGLTRGGLYIGWLERFLVLLLLLIDQPNGIGFLIAAKSILRFGEIKDPAQRKLAEYIIIGTFLSFGWALLIAVLTQKALRYWMP